MEKKFYIDNNGLSIELEKLKICPFCGSDAELTFIGNAATRERKVIIRCTGVSCNVKQTKAGLRATSMEVAAWAVQAWNKRVLINS